MAQNKVFLDTSILITALLSSKGGSFYILTQEKKPFQFFINDYVFTEALDVVKQKFFSRKDIEHNLFLLVGLARITVLPNPSKFQLRGLRGVIEREDAPILASALRYCDYLLTLDRDFLDKRVHDFVRGRIKIYNPREFIEDLDLTST